MRIEDSRDANRIYSTIKCSKDELGDKMKHQLAAGCKIRLSFPELVKKKKDKKETVMCGAKECEHDSEDFESDVEADDAENPITQVCRMLWSHNGVQGDCNKELHVLNPSLTLVVTHRTGFIRRFNDLIATIRFPAEQLDTNDQDRVARESRQVPDIQIIPEASEFKDLSEARAKRRWVMIASMMMSWVAKQSSIVLVDANIRMTFSEEAKVNKQE